MGEKFIVWKVYKLGGLYDDNVFINEIQALQHQRRSVEAARGTTLSHILWEYLGLPKNLSANPHILDCTIYDFATDTLDKSYIEKKNTIFDIF